jgi:hypothetical protein
MEVHMKKNKFIILSIIFILLVILNGSTYGVTPRLSGFCNKNDLIANEGINGKSTENLNPFKSISIKNKEPNINEAISSALDLLKTNPYTNCIIPDPTLTGISVYKPNIYIYAMRNLSVNVQLFPYEYITISEPSYPKNTGWNAKIKNGSINGKEDFLFYEACVPDSGFQKEEGFIVKGSCIKEDLSCLLDLYHFSAREKYDFIEYWTGMLDEGLSYTFYPQYNECIDRIMPVIITPKPDHIFRIWFYIVPIDSEHNQEVIKPHIVVPEREGYYAIEWGGIIG